MPGTPSDISPPPPLFAPSEKVAEIALQDVVRYQEHLLKLIQFHDEKSHKVLAVYISILAAVTTISFGLNQIGQLSLFLKCFLGGSALSVLLGCAWAYTAAWTAEVYLPGRKPDFWFWALRNEQDVRETVTAYLNQSEAMIAVNEAVSTRSSTRMTRAYLCGLAAPFVGASAVWLAYWGP
ncbi:MAG: hypothetical protein EON84_17115 [Bradyrhizobiaceae bacterium]|nr:MAG: hypothetical protein EON84_17115 [Bradyrhizobiaceae bacterium]